MGSRGDATAGRRLGRRPWGMGDPHAACAGCDPCVLNFMSYECIHRFGHSCDKSHWGFPFRSGIGGKIIRDLDVAQPVGTPWLGRREHHVVLADPALVDLLALTVKRPGQVETAGRHQHEQRVERRREDRAGDGRRHARCVVTTAAGRRAAAAARKQQRRQSSRGCVRVLMSPFIFHIFGIEFQEKEYSKIK